MRHTENCLNGDAKRPNHVQLSTAHERCTVYTLYALCIQCRHDHAEAYMMRESLRTVILPVAKKCDECDTVTVIRIDCLYKLRLGSYRRICRMLLRTFEHLRVFHALNAACKIF